MSSFDYSRFDHLDDSDDEPAPAPAPRAGAGRRGRAIGLQRCAARWRRRLARPSSDRAAARVARSWPSATMAPSAFVVAAGREAARGPTRCGGPSRGKAPATTAALALSDAADAAADADYEVARADHRIPRRARAAREARSGPPRSARPRAPPCRRTPAAVQLARWLWAQSRRRVTVVLGLGEAVAKGARVGAGPSAEVSSCCVACALNAEQRAPPSWRCGRRCGATTSSGLRGRRERARRRRPRRARCSASSSRCGRRWGAPLPGGGMDQLIAGSVTAPKRSRSDVSVSATAVRGADRAAFRSRRGRRAEQARRAEHRTRSRALGLVVAVVVKNVRSCLSVSRSSSS